MVKIYKYRIGPNNLSVIKGRIVSVLKVDWQDEDLYAWCLTSNLVKESQVKFHILPTGLEFEFNENWRYVDSIQDGEYVWHIFYEFFVGKEKKGMH